MHWASLISGIFLLARNTEGTVLPRSELPFPEWHFANLAAASQNAYCKPEDNAPGITIGDMTILSTSGNGDQAQRTTLFHSPSLGIIIAGEGSNTTSAVSNIRDLDDRQSAAPKEFNMGADVKIMNGWLSDFTKTWPLIKIDLENAKKKFPKSKIYLTGQSQGSAYIELIALAVNAAYGNDEIAEIIVFGPPRVGNSAYADEFDRRFKGKYVAVTNGNDWVASLLPPRVLGPWEYHHPSNLLWINPANSSSYHLFENGEDPAYYSQVKPQVVSNYKEWLLEGPIYWGDHDGVYMGTPLYSNPGPCPAQIGVGQIIIDGYYGLPQPDSGNVF